MPPSWTTRPVLPHAATDQLDHANTPIATDVYFGRRLAATGAATVLEALAT
ncbi:hypothetical protein ACI79P_14380 [Blastococcus sp. SYSU DS0510]